MNIFKKQIPEKNIAHDDNLFIAVIMGIASIYAVWLITSLLIAILS